MILLVSEPTTRVENGEVIVRGRLRNQRIDLQRGLGRSGIHLTGTKEMSEDQETGGRDVV